MLVGVTAEEMWVIQAHGTSKVGQPSLGLKGRAQGPGVQESRDMARAPLESLVGSTHSGAEPALRLPSHRCMESRPPLSSQELHETNLSCYSHPSQPAGR